MGFTKSLVTDQKSPNHFMDFRND